MAIVLPTLLCFRVDETLPEEIPEELGWDSESTWLLSSLDSSDMTTVTSSPLAGTLVHGIGLCEQGDPEVAELLSQAQCRDTSSPPSLHPSVSYTHLTLPTRRSV